MNHALPSAAFDNLDDVFFLRSAVLISHILLLRFFPLSVSMFRCCLLKWIIGLSGGCFPRRLVRGTSLFFLFFQFHHCAPPHLFNFSFLFFILSLCGSAEWLPNSLYYYYYYLHVVETHGNNFLLFSRCATQRRRVGLWDSTPPFFFLFFSLQQASLINVA